MREHESIRELLPLAAADALDPHERRRVEAHLRACAECRRELERFGGVGAALRSLPTPQPSPALIARVERAAREKLGQGRERRADLKVAALLVVLSWTATLLMALVLRLVWGEVSGGTGGGGLWPWLAGYMLAGWLAASVAAAILGLRSPDSRRFV